VSDTKTPIDVEDVVLTLRQMLEAGKTEDMLTLVAQLLLQMKSHNAALELHLAKLLREKFGRKSEKIDPSQLALFLGTRTAEPSDDAAEPEHNPTLPDTPKRPDKPKSARRGHGRRPLPSHLPRRSQLVSVADGERACACCGKPRRIFIGEKSIQLDYEPGGFFIVDISRQTAIDDCDCSGEPVFTTAPAPPRIIDGGLPGPGLLAKVVTAKYADHLPLERQATIYAREGVDLAPSTLGDWTAAAATLLLAIANRIRELALQAYVLWTDDTGLRVLDERHSKNIKRGHMWVYIGDKRWVAFVYTEDWKAKGPETFLANRVGYVVADGYSGYHALFRRRDATAIEVGCMMHSRRYFKKALDAKDLRAAYPLDLFRRLYDVEAVADDRGLDAQARLEMRQQHSRPVFDELGRWIRKRHGNETPKSYIGKALTYAVNHWTALGRFLDDGRLPIDNGEAERALRKVALGRLNWLFAGSDAGAERAAILYTVIGTCLANRVNPFEYLRDVFAKIAAGWPSQRIDELLPPNWAAAQQQQPEQQEAA
jgi:transposase